MKTVGIIGAGIGGIASGIRLALKGYAVDIYEQAAQPGGKINSLKSGECRFDTGPSLFTLPALVEELFQISGKNISAYINYKKLDTICRYFYPDGTIINAYSDPMEFAREIEEKTGEPAEHILLFLAKSKRIWKLTKDVFIFRPIHTMNNFFTQDSLYAILHSYELHAFSTMHQVVEKYFQDHRVIQLFDRYATYNGSNPYKAPGTLMVIPHLEHNIGAYFPVTGMYGIVEGLVKLAEELKVKFHFHARAERIETGKRRIKGITIHGKTIPKDIVISDVDIHNTYQNLLSSSKIPKKTTTSELSTSALIFYWEINRKFTDLDVHNILFSGNYAEEFQYLFDRKDIYHDPTVYIFISSKIVRDDAPQGHENWFVMINVPPNTGQDWQKLTQQARHFIVNKIDSMLHCDIEKHIKAEEFANPVTIEQKTASRGGALYGNSSNSRYSAFNRHANFSRTIRGLYFTGGSVHPGGGIPLCLASAKIVSNLIQKQT